MALWPFRRKSGRKRARSRTNLSDSEGLAHADRLAQPRSHTMNDLPVKSRRTLKKRRTDPLAPRVPRSRDGSYSPGRQDRISIDRHRGGVNLQGRQAVDPLMRPSGLRSCERIGDDAAWTQVPTLHGKGNNHQLARRKSSKRRREDLDREAEIRALANFASARPGAEMWLSSKPARNGKRINTGAALGRHWDSRSSDISLPTAASIRSAMSSDSDLGAFQVSALDSLAPRPTLRYTSNPRWAPNGPGPSRTNSQKRKLTERPSIPEETIKAHKRIDELADDFDASDLRELMERDKRRRERKQQRDQARAERRLSRLAEKQRAAYQAALEQGTTPPQNLERGVAGRELEGLGIDTTSAVVTSSTRRAEDEALNHVDQYDGASESSARRPLAEFHRTDSAPLEAVAPQKEEPAAEDYAPPSPASPILGRLLGSKKPASKLSYDPGQSRSTISPAPGVLENIATSPSSIGAKKARRSFSSFFRWGGRTKRESQPSSFSNTSREEMQAVIQSYAAEPTASPSPAPAAPAAPVAPVAAVSDAAARPIPARTLSSGVPKRTRSRFREDLPELPLSPPDSRKASPEPVPIPEHPRETNEAGQETESPEDVLTPIGPTADVAAHHPSGFSQDSYGPSPQPHSISLASIDSEASWLSGRLGGKRSPTSRHRRQGPTSSRATSTTGSEEELGIAEDEYLARLTPAQLTRTTSKHRRSAGEALPSSDEDEPMQDGDMKWGVSARRQVHVSGRNPHDSLRSHEGVLNSFDEEMEIEAQSEAGDVVDPEKDYVELQRATSVKLKGREHARQVSAGSAKLLEIAPRESTDSKRRSSGPVFI